MLFEIFAPFDGPRVFWTEHNEAVPDKDQVKQMYKSGYRFRCDGKEFVPAGCRKVQE